MRLLFDIKVSLSFIVIFVRLAFQYFFSKTRRSRFHLVASLFFLIVFKEPLIIISSRTSTVIKSSIESMETLIKSVFVIDNINNKVWSQQKLFCFKSEIIEHHTANIFSSYMLFCRHTYHLIYKNSTSFVYVYLLSIISFYK